MSVETSSTISALTPSKKSHNQSHIFTSTSGSKTVTDNGATINTKPVRSPNSTDKHTVKSSLFPANLNSVLNFTAKDKKPATIQTNIVLDEFKPVINKKKFGKNVLVI